MNVGRLIELLQPFQDETEVVVAMDFEEIKHNALGYLSLGYCAGEGVITLVPCNSPRDVTYVDLIGGPGES